MWLRFLNQEDPLEEEKAMLSSMYSYLKNSMERGAWWVTVHWVLKNQTCLSMHMHTNTHTNEIMLGIYYKDRVKVSMNL